MVVLYHIKKQVNSYGYKNPLQITVKAGDGGDLIAWKIKKGSYLEPQPQPFFSFEPEHEPSFSDDFACSCDFSLSLDLLPQQPMVFLL